MTYTEMYAMEENTLHPSATFQGYLYRVAEAVNPLQTELTFCLTDFQPNKNKQAVPQSEAENIIRTIQHMPIKIRPGATGKLGHSGARPIGTIVSAWAEDDKIMASAFVWNKEFPNETEYLKSAHAENEKIGTSWELFYGTSTNADGVEWLHDITMSGSCIVDDPAYGGRTNILAVAETEEPMDENKGTDLIEPTVNVEESTAETDIVAVEETTNSLYDIITVLNEIWYEMYEAERIDSAVSTAEEALDRAKTILAEWKKRKGVMAELQLFKTTAENKERFTARAEQLTFTSAEFIESRQAFILSASDEEFTRWVNDLKAVAGKQESSAETKTPIKIPELRGAQHYSVADVVELLRKKD